MLTPWYISLLAHLVLVTWVARCSSEELPAEEYPNITSLQIKNSEIATSASGNIEHMEFDLYRNDGSILFADESELKTTDEMETKVVASGFSYVTGFKQLNASHVIIVDNMQHCIRILNRVDNSTRVVAGMCGILGDKDGVGTSARFTTPWSIEIDKRNPGHLLLTGYVNNALRSIDIATGNVSTVIRTGFSKPKGLAWYNSQLLVFNNNHISEVSWSSDGTVTNKKLTTTTTTPGYKDGDFSVAQFNSPREIQQLRNGLFLGADRNSQSLRLISMSQKKVLPVCIGSTNCTVSTSFGTSINSLLISNNTIYVGGLWKIFKLTGIKVQSDGCFIKNQTVYVYPGQKSAQGNLPPGEYKVQKTYGLNDCSYYRLIRESPIVRTAAFKVDYEVKCSSLDSNSSKSVVSKVLSYRKKQLQKFCGEECEMSTEVQPWYNCTDGLMTVKWPTDKVFLVDEKKVPEIFTSTIIKRLKTSPIYNPKMIILNHFPPFIKPKSTSNGELVQIVMTSSCANKTKKYQPITDSCVEDLPANH